ncbi:28S ribosomal protein S24, mitochondrial [Caerostris darwini]|uniref:28S ribosomal protein S24, mitochondrial n=1 Tax=Caerostris darwini TaxID=1538125 RepID=A0AAV4R6U1_9ARAC|nr:28S ribosomal protein S24, mitochondrial [Caerostris darwini]
MTALCRSLILPMNKVLAVRALSTSAVCCKTQAGKYKRTKNQSKPLTYEQFNAPYQIHHRKSWNTWNTSNLFEADDEIRASQTAVEDFFIRKFMFGTWHRIFVSDVIIKRRHNLIIIAGIVTQSLQASKLYFLIGYTEEMLSYIFKCPVKIELQSVADKKDVVFKYI